MFTQFFPLLVAGVATRIGANHLVRSRLSLKVDIPQGLRDAAHLRQVLADYLLSRKLE